MKIKTLLVFVLMAMSGFKAMAQTDFDTFHVIDKNGNVVTDGSVLTISETEVKEGKLQISSGLSVKNMTNEEQAIGLDFSIDQLDNGAPKCCFPNTCLNGTDHVGSYSQNADVFVANEVRDFQTEWEPVEYGTCKMTFQFKLYNIKIMKFPDGKGGMSEVPTAGDFKAYGPKIKVNFVYADPASVNGVTSDNAKPLAYYNLAGQKTETMQNGVNIVVLSNGKTIKVINK